MIKFKYQNTKRWISLLLAFLLFAVMFSSFPCSAENQVIDGNTDSETKNTTSEEPVSPEEGSTEENTDDMYFLSMADLPAPPEIESESAIVIDAQTGQVLYEKNAYVTQYPASTTKILTTLLALENCSLDETIIMSEGAINGIEPDSNNITCQVGEEFNLYDALHAVMLFSANEVSSAVAEHVAGSVDDFCIMMNEKARSLGCVNTNFANANGLTLENNYSCAYDLSLIAKEALKNETFREITAKVNYQIPATNLTEEPRDLYQSNRLIREDSDYYYPYCQGGKTGYTLAAGGNLVSWAEKDDLSLICVVMKAPGNPANYLDSTALYKYFFEYYHKINPLDNFEFSPTTKTAAVDYLNDYYGGLNLGGMTLSTDLSLSLVCPKTVTVENLSFPVSFSSDGIEGNQIGTISIEFNGTSLASLPVSFSDYISSTDKVAIEEAYANGTLKRPEKKSYTGLIVFLILLIIVAVYLLYRLNYFRKLKNRYKKKDQIAATDAQSMEEKTNKIQTKEKTATISKQDTRYKQDTNKKTPPETRGTENYKKSNNITDIRSYTKSRYSVNLNTTQTPRSTNDALKQAQAEIMQRMHSKLGLDQDDDE